MALLWMFGIASKSISKPKGVFEINFMAFVISVEKLLDFLTAISS